MKKYSRAVRTGRQLVLRASGSKTWAGARKKSISIPLALTSPQDFPQRIRFSWESGNSWEGAAVDTHIPPLSCSPPRSHPLSREEGMGVGAGAVIGTHRRR